MTQADHNLRGSDADVPPDSLQKRQVPCAQAPEKQVGQRAARRNSAGWLGTLFRAGRDLLFPPRCVCCHIDLPPEHHGPLLCDKCVERLCPKVWPGCRRCGSSLAVLGEARTQTDCPLCRNRDLWFDTVVPLGSYQAGWDEIVLRMKWPNGESLGLNMGRLLMARRARELQELQADVVVPIPMHWARWLRRGMNSPDGLAKQLGQWLGVPVLRRVLFRRRNTLPQKNLPPAERLRNMEGAFGVRRAKWIKDTRVLLVDDVLTTGATSNEAAKMLREAGAAHVAVAVLARAQGPAADLLRATKPPRKPNQAKSADDARTHLAGKTGGPFPSDHHK